MTTTAKLESGQERGASSRHPIVRVLCSEYLVLVVTLAYFFALCPFTPGLLSIENLRNILSSLLPLLIVSLGQTVVLITGGIDLSVSSIIAVTSITGAGLMNGDTGLFRSSFLAPVAGGAGMLLVGGILGAVNGAAITRFKMPPFIVTLTTMMFFSGFAIWLTQSKNIGNLPAGFNRIGARTEIALLVTTLIAAAIHLTLNRSLAGRWFYAVGHNVRAAFISGVPVRWVVLSAYVLSGVCAAASSVLYTGRLETGSPVLGQRILLDVIGATVIGGASLYGGKGKVVGTIFGALFLTVLDNSLNLLNLSHFSIMMTKGGVILLAALTDTMRHRVLQRGSAASSEALSEAMELRPQRDAQDDSFLLELRGIEKSFGSVPVLRQVRLNLKVGETLGLVGENGAGKSTLMNILGGTLAADGGEMRLAGQPYCPKHPKEAAKKGVAFVHQELNLFPNLTIAENIFVGSFPKRWVAGLGWIDRRSVRVRSEALLAQVGLTVSPSTLVENLSAGERQLVEIARALSIDARIIILDEPTTSLTATEADHLFQLMQFLQARGVSMIYISHNLPDVLRLCDRLVILRDGAVAAAGPKGDFSMEAIVSLMVGRSIKQMYPSRAPSARAEVIALEVRHLSQPGVVKDIAFKLFQGEVLGIAGLMGSGRSELVRILFGLDPYQHGELCLNGAPYQPFGPRQSIQNGIAFVSEDRHREGLCLEASIAENMALVALRKLARLPLYLIDQSTHDAAVTTMRRDIHLTTAVDNKQPVKVLSGGNQQKVVLGKWLLAGPRVFILDEPTRGIDVGAKVEVYNLINQLTAKGAGVLVISSEIEELIGICDRILVMNRGEIRDELVRPQFDRERILRSALAGAGAKNQPADPPTL